MTVYILGAGPAGLAVADGLHAETNEKIIVCEGDNIVGGLARTLEWEGHGSHDLGPHKIFSLDQDLMQRVKNLLPADQWLAHQKIARIFMGGHFLSYPPSPISLRRVYGSAVFCGLVLSYVWCKLISLIVPKTEADTFQEDIESRVGKGLAEKLFCPIARKLWGEPSSLDAKLSKGRIQTPSIVELIKKTLNPKAHTNFETLTYDYPRGGLGRLWQAIVKRTEDRAQYLLGKKVSGFSVVDGKITAISLTSKEGNTSEITISDGDFVVSTLPLGRVTGFFGSHMSRELTQAAESYIALNDLALVFLHIDQKYVFPDSWLIIPDPAIAFHRLSEQKAFDPQMTPNGTILCAEIMGHEGKELLAKTDAELQDIVLNGLQAMGCSGLPLLGLRVIRLPKSYPVYKAGFQPVLDEVLSKLDEVKNFRSIGRQGAFNYIGTLDAMDIGYGFARWYANRAESSWSDERQRTSHYPVLD